MLQKFEQAKFQAQYDSSEQDLLEDKNFLDSLVANSRSSDKNRSHILPLSSDFKETSNKNSNGLKKNAHDSNSSSRFLKKLTTHHATVTFVNKWKLKMNSKFLVNKMYKTTRSIPARAYSTKIVRGTTTVLSMTPSISVFHYPSFNEKYYKKNEFYSIFVSILTAAAFLIFIMWRWFRMKSDLRRALEEQQQIQRHERSSLNTDCAQDSCVDNISGISSNNGIRWPNNGGRYMLISNNREELQAYAATLINQLSNGEYQTPRQHQQMIDTARYCLQQLKLHARLTQHYRLQNNNSYYGRNNFNYNNYSTFNSQRRERRSNGSYGSTGSSPFLHDFHSSCQSLNPIHTNNLPPAPPVSSSSLSSAITNEDLSFLLNTSSNDLRYNSTLTASIRLQNKVTPNEPPPAYESLLVKSSSLPSYHHITDQLDLNECVKKLENNEKNDC